MPRPGDHPRMAGFRLKRQSKNIAHGEHPNGIESSKAAAPFDFQSRQALRLSAVLPPTSKLFRVAARAVAGLRAHILSSSSSPRAPINGAQGRREAIPAQRAHERGVNLCVSFEMIGDAGAVLNLAQKIAQRRRAKPMEGFDKALASKPMARRGLCLR
jgi:hypothetical protein